jgi:GntR family phosphonate transport system transcriptional regulator
VAQTKAPLWKQVRDALAEDIRGGTLQPGERLPTEQVLSERFGVHRHTTRRALQELREMGLVRTDQGRGSLVLERPYEYQMGRRTRFSENMSLNSLNARSHFLYGDVIPASDIVAERLEIPVRSKVSYIKMYGEAGGKRVFVASQYMPYTDMEDLIRYFRETGSMTRSYARYGISDYFRKVSRITTRMSNADEGAVLGLAQKQPLLVVEYVNVDKRDRPLEFGVTRFCGERMEIVVRGEV